MTAAVPGAKAAGTTGPVTPAPASCDQSVTVPDTSACSCARSSPGRRVPRLVTRQIALAANDVKTSARGSSGARARLTIATSTTPRLTSATPASEPPPTIWNRGGRRASWR